jgi:uncharacterized protein YaiL (DUF2058 family)
MPCNHAFGARIVIPRARNVGYAQPIAGTTVEGRPGQERQGRQDRARPGQAAPGQGAHAEDQVDARKLQAERAERDRALAAERNAEARAKEIRAQVRQIIQTTKVKREGDSAYRFPDGEKIASLFVNDALRAQLASGALVIARAGDGYELIPRLPADKIHARAPDMIVLDHGRKDDAPAATEEDLDDYYKQFVVPDDLIW